MPKFKCKDKKSALGIWTESWCGNYCQGSPQFVCDVDGNCTVYHCIKVINYKSYDLDVTVSGKIDTPCRVAFKPKKHPDSSTYWEDSVIGLMDRQEKIFNHIELCTHSGQKGHQDIKTTIEAEWPQYGTNERIRITFPVSAI